MNFLAKLLRGISFIPAIVHGIEALFGGRTGVDKRESAMAFALAALSFTDAVAEKSIVDADKFRNGIGQVIDGVVACLNASVWSNEVPEFPKEPCTNAAASGVNQSTGGDNV